ncbi:HAD family hydrolase [Paenibacillus sp. SYP-B4298]|uniref:HAD family hydrolase n=1 Tax=Paenibacillus sp. SYP-B4298 TaxID=2996034 RepID=UPI0022DDD8E7|nr:HAD family hydrolase [Paenibacillus sp. SYP-B4298]
MIKGIIFDMDNTLLQSRIDFAAMKNDLQRLLAEHDLIEEGLQVDEYTPSMLLQHAREQEGGRRIEPLLLETITRYEYAGMKDVGLEPGASELLHKLSGYYTLVLLTNNAQAATERALRATALYPLFELIICRDQVKALKPAPDGYELAKSHFPEIAPEQWVSVGDAWIDGRASIDASIPFIAYKTSVEHMRSKGVEPVASIQALSELIAWLRDRRTDVSDALGGHAGAPAYNAELQDS